MKEQLIPYSWAITYLKNIVLPTKGKKPTRLEDSSFAESVPYIDIKALESDQIDQYADIRSSKLFSENDIAIVWDGARCGWVAKARKGAIGSTICALTPIKINSTYLYYYLLSKYSLINSRPRGVGIPHVDPNFLWFLEVPLPPLAEQKRIADKLDVLFGQLNIVQKAIERIPELIKNFRQQILSSAVTGKLTEEWRDRENILNEYREFKCSEYREYNFEIPDQWILLSFADVVRIESYLVNPIDYPELPLIAPDNIESMTGRIISKPTVAEINPISPKHLFSGNSLIYSKIRPYLSKIAFVDFKGLCSADMYPLKTSLDIH